jgi:putative phosphoesterase
MKIAVMSDIHGNMQALSAVMENIEEQECDKIFVLGDYAMAGPQPRDAIQFFMDKLNNKKYKMIQGNTDLMLAKYSEDLYDMLQDSAPIMADALKFDAKELDNMERAFLLTLPEKLEVTEGGVKFLLVHGSPRKNNEDILPDIRLDKVEEMLTGVKADAILCGHTHIPCGFQTRTKKTVINVGSVGRPFTPEPKACYLTIVVENGKCEYEHHFVEYDKNAAYEILRKRNFWGADVLANTLLNPEKRHF